MLNVYKWKKIKNAVIASSPDYYAMGDNSFIISNVNMMYHISYVPMTNKVYITVNGDVRYETDQEIELKKVVYLLSGMTV